MYGLHGILQWHRADWCIGDTVSLHCNAILFGTQRGFLRLSVFFLITGPVSSYRVGRPPSKSLTSSPFKVFLRCYLTLWALFSAVEQRR
jgi:hypothetical protein